METLEEALKKLLIEKKILSESKVTLLAKQAKSEGKTFSDYLFEKEIVSDTDLGKMVATLMGVPFIKLSEVNIVESLLKIVPFAVASHQLIMPFNQTPGQIHLAMYKPDNREMISFLEQKTGLKVVPYFATKKDIKSSLKIYSSDINKKFNGLLKSVLADPSKIESLQDASKILDTVILFAYQNNASDIHIEPQKVGLMVRYRIDGILHTITELPHAVDELVISRIKVLANLRTDEHRAPQDGRFKIDLDGNEITLRVSILPVYEGEKVVMRLLSSQKQELNLDILGYTDKNLAIIKSNIAKTHGMLLVTGPTGSGKTTTLYSILKLLNSSEVNISTIEDPIEYRLDGTNQIQVNQKTNLTFANGLRSILRQDPDIVMVGEIRDEETASIAINAALTGHLVLATLHTNDAATTLPRLLEMGVEGFLIAATTNAVVAQRLVREICVHCKEEYKISRKVLEDMNTIARIKQNIVEVFDREIQNNPELGAKKTSDEFILTKGKGCDHCENTGFNGRLAIAEVIDISTGIKEVILNNGNATQIADLARKEGMVSMFEDGMIKVLKGLTTIEEILRVMRE